MLAINKLYLKKQTSRSLKASGSLASSIRSGFHNFRKGFLEQDLQCHAVTTTAMGGEKITITFEDTIIEANVMIVIIAMEDHIKLVKPEPVTFLGVTLGLIDLADHSRVHYQSPFYRR
jgi:hypothetical protein